VVLAQDAGPRTIEKVVRLAEAKGIPVLRGPEAAELGAGSEDPSAGCGGERSGFGAWADSFGGVSGKRHGFMI